MVHVPGKRNSIADALSHTPSYFGDQTETDGDIDFDFKVEGDVLAVLLDHAADGPMDSHIDKLVNSIPEMSKDSPDIVAMEEAGKTDRDYCYMVKTIKQSLPHKMVASESELHAMGGEYSRLRVIPGRDLIVLAEKKNTLKIFPPSRQERASWRNSIPLGKNLIL